MHWENKNILVTLENILFAVEIIKNKKKKILVVAVEIKKNEKEKYACCSRKNDKIKKGKYTCYSGSQSLCEELAASALPAQDPARSPCASLYIYLIYNIFLSS